MKKAIQIAGVVVVVIGLVPTVSSGASFQVLWDTSHGVLGASEPSGSFAGLVQHLGVNGFSVDTTSQGFLVDDPAPYDVIVVNVGSTWNSAYTPAEVARIVDFVNDGGGMLILGDHPGVTSNSNVQPVASAFGVTLGIEIISPHDTFTTDLASHPIFAGISEIYMRAAGEISAVSPSIEAAWQEGTGKALVAAGTHGSGRVVTTGDFSIWESDYYNMADNRQFAVNTFEYLAAPEPATLSLLALGGLAMIRGRRRK